MSAPISGLLLGPSGEVISSPQSRQFATDQRRLQARFDAAQNSRETLRHWANADHLGPNSELDAGTRRTLRSRARYEAANNSYLSGILRTLANDCIGTGPGLQVIDQDIPKEAHTAVENRFYDWGQSIGLPQKLRHMRLAKARDGELFSQFFQNDRPRDRVTLDFKPFEADYVTTTDYDKTFAALLDGVYVDEQGNVIAYNVLREHPGENYQTMMQRADVIPASQILHLFHADRPGQYRGVPEVTPALPLFAILRDYTLDVAIAARSAATPSWVLETQQPPSTMTFGDAWETLETERGMGMTLPGGYKMAQLKAEQPTSTYPQFKREILTEIARCLNVPYNVAACDSSSYNYSSGRLDHRTYYKSIRVERSNIESVVLERIFARWWREAWLLDDYLPNAARRRKPPAHGWRWDGDEHVDPTKEADASITRVGGGLTAIDDEVARLGGDAEVVHRKNAAAFGMSLADYRKRLADKYFGATVKSSSQPEADLPAASPYQTGGRNG